MECLCVLQSFKDYEESTVREAIFAAGEYKCKEAIPFLVELLQSNSVGLQEAAEISLRRINGPETVNALIPLLNHKDPSIRNIAMDILRDIGDQNIDSLISLLDSPNRDLRIFVADILGHIKSVIVVMPLCKLLLNDPDVNVRQQAAISLGNIRHPEAINCLKKALDDEEWVQYSVIEAFKKIKDPSSVPYLLEILGKGSEMIDSMILETLGEIGTVKVIPVLLSKLRVYPPFLKIKVVEAIVKILGEQIKFTFNDKEKKEFLSFLREALQDDDWAVQEVAIKGMEYLGLPEASKDIFSKLLEIDEDADMERYEKIKNSLVKLGFNKYLKEAALSEDDETTRKAIDVLIQLEDLEVKEFLKSIFWEKNRDIQREITNYLSKNCDEEDRNFFVDVLKKHKDGTVIKNCLAFLGKIRAVDCDELIISFLEHKFPDVREKALEICITLHTPKIVEKFIEFTKNNDPLKRIIGITGLGRLGKKEYEKYISSALNDKDPEVKKAYIDAISNIYKNDFSTLINRLEPFLEDKSYEVKLKSLEVLYSYATSKDLKKLIPTIQKALDDENKWVKIKALEILGEIKEGVDVNKIIPLLQYPHKLIQIKAIEVLGLIGNHRSIQALLSFIKETKDQELIEVTEKILAKYK